MTRCFTAGRVRLKNLIYEQLNAWASISEVKPQRIALKPNWVMHETDPAFPIEALVTDAGVIEATIEACLKLFPDIESLIVGDCPLQSADWPLMCRQSGLDRVIAAFSADRRVVFRDLRKHAFKSERDQTFLVESQDEHGDPAGYCEIELGARSHLEPISDQAHRFAVNDYSPSVTKSNHRLGSHRYLVSQSLLDTDLFINLPKWKSHQKSGVTGALKNLVGINGDKAYLPHFRRGAPIWGGDEYRDENRWLYWAQTRVRETVQKRSRLAYKVLKPGWELVKQVKGIETRLADRSVKPRQFYIAGGAWHGNDTLWRMIYDLNLILGWADREGKVQAQRQRHYFCIVDGLVGGEGNGPLQPLPRPIDWLVFGTDPFAIDASLCWFMGFDPTKTPLIQNRDRFAGSGWGDFALDNLQIELDGERLVVSKSPVNFQFIPPPGWRNHIER
jgi:uncharacterized protein (DUF362 family)